MDINLPRYVKYVLIVLILFFSVLGIHEVLSRYDFYIPEMDLYLLFVALFICFLSYLLSIPIYKELLGIFNFSPPWANICSMAFVPQAGKYLPGSVFLYAGLMMYLKALGFSIKKGLFFLFVIQLLIILTSLLIAVSIDLITEQSLHLVIIILAVMAVLFLSVTGFRQFKGVNVSNYLVAYHKIFLVIILLAGQIILSGLAFYFILYSMTDLSIQILPKIVFANSLATVSGILAFFAPGGIGVKEGVLFYYMNQEIHVANIVIVAVVLFRIITICMDIFLASLAYFFFHKEVHINNEK